MAPPQSFPPEVIAALVAALAAIAAVLIGPFVTIRASKNQMLGPMRQAWINSLRDTVSEFVATVSIGMPQSAGLLSPDDTLRHSAQMERQAQIQKAYLLKAKIQLLINPKEEMHTELVRLAEAVFSAYTSGGSASPSVVALLEHTQTVLKTEWNVVKK